MPHRPDEEGPEPEGGRAAERLRQHLDSRYPTDEWPDAPIEDVRDAGDESLVEGPPAEGEDWPDETEPPPDQGDAVPGETDVPPDDGDPMPGQTDVQPEADRQPDDPEESENAH